MSSNMNTDLKSYQKRSISPGFSLDHEIREFRGSIAESIQCQTTRANQYQYT